ncbi:ArsR family transcriptional regulator (plasmid) [Vibrio sp. qd031]|jgi:DNA-binding transcriptional ArsR family regulator|uniref:Helix-turn-helix transcriptional regulator n=1 Tax=Vibrio ulleungensis TaxID=2807619 RepID=A0ABS2HHZ6_9VIBR|nr:MULTISPECIES: metalloregulator ArsR/SmtB family transcription factor [Vibrio]MBM7035717.1 helix-turn-helix transcriptional regulator [Vibrio ulleungensis]ORT52550.1 ArsR family transcriptional regulator [Vibrio sp. qd031]
MSVVAEDMQSQAQEVSELLKTMAHPVRLLVLCQLVNQELSAGELVQRSSLSQSAFSQHLTVLKKHGIVKVRKEAQQVFYSLADERVEKLLDSLYGLFCKS